MRRVWSALRRLASARSGPRPFAVMESAFVERRYELGSGRLMARFDQPVRAPDGEYRCHWSVAWPGRALRGYACGEDGLQALMLAMRSVHIGLVDSDAYRAGRLTLWGQADLDLPPTWGVGPLYRPSRNAASCPPPRSSDPHPFADGARHAEP